MTTWYSYSIHLSRGTLASAMAKIEEILQSRNWTYENCISGRTIIYQGIRWRVKTAEITHDRYGRYVDSIVLFGGKYITLNIVVDDLSDTSDRIADVFTEAFGKPYREKHMQAALTDEEQAMPLDFPKLDFDFRRRGLYHPPSEDRRRTGKGVRLKTALERSGAGEHYTIRTDKAGGVFLERRNKRNHVMTVYLGCSRTCEIGVDGETLLQSATCNAMYEGVNFTRMLFQMHSHLTTQKALDEFVGYSIDCINKMYDEIQNYRITDIETPPWFAGFYSCN